MARTALIVLGLWLTWSAGVSGAQEAVSEHALRAAMVFKFLQFAEWPTVEKAVLLCVASGEREQLQALEALAGERVHGAALSVVRYPATEKRFQVLYVDARQRWDEVLGSRARLERVLTIGAYPGFVHDGGMIEIVPVAGRMRFDVNLGEIRKAGLRLDPQLLNLARRVRR